VPHINLPSELPGMAGLQSFKPATSDPLRAFTHQLLRGPSSLTVAEREMIAALVSTRNECTFCTMTHVATAAHAAGDRDLVCAAVDEPDAAPISERLRALLAIAAKVQRSGLDVVDDDIARARAAGASDEDLHDTVLVAAAFCMFNRYVDGLAASTPTDPALYEMIGQHLAQNGYAQPIG
jgi:uncharacterized peroxidase-related enzyme